jgi:hypothetical protein
LRSGPAVTAAVAYCSHLDDLAVGAGGYSSWQAGGDVRAWRGVRQWVEVRELGGGGGHRGSDLWPCFGDQGGREAEGFRVDVWVRGRLLGCFFGFHLVGNRQHL